MISASIFVSAAIATAGTAQTEVSGLDPHKAITQYVHEAWQIEQGLPQNSVNAIVQASDGYVWFGTQSGLVRFDGVTFTIYSPTNTTGLGDKDVRSLFVDREGSLWIGTALGGISRLRGGQFTTFPSDLAPNTLISCVYQDRAGTLWAGSREGVARFEDGRFHLLPGLSSDIHAFAEEHDGTLLIGSDAGISAWREDRFVPWQPPGATIRVPVWTIQRGRQGSLWIGTSEGLLRASGERLERFTTRQGLLSNAVRALLELRNGQLWVGTEGGGVARFADGGFQAFSTRNGLSDDAVTALFEDREGSLWVGTFGGGLNRIRDPIFTTYTRHEGLSRNYLWSVYGDRNRNLWIGTYTGGLDRFTDGVFTNYTVRDGLPSDTIYCTVQTSDADIWIGTANGLGRLHHGRWQQLAAARGFPGGSVFALHEDQMRALWIGGRTGLFRWKDGTLRDYTREAGIRSAHVWTFEEDRDGTLWFGTIGSGLVRFQQGRFTIFTSRDGLSNDNVQSLHASDEGLWIGTVLGGLHLWREGRIIALPLSPKGALPDLQAIVEDDLGRFWLNSTQGLFRVPKRELLDAAAGKRPSVELQAFDQLDGPRKIELTAAGQNAAWKGPDGRIWFPSTKGLIVVDPRHVRTNPLAPPVHIERLLVDGREMVVSDGLELPPGANRLEIHYTANSLLIPERVRFRYRLEGLDPDWTDPGSRRVAYYTHVPGGRYRFRVLAANNDGVWNETGASLSFRVRPRFHETAAFYAVCVLGALVSGFGLHRLRIRRLKARERWLEAQVDERTSALQEARDKLEQRVQERTAELRQVNIALEADIIERKRAEAALRRSETMSAMGMLVGGVAHEVRNPLFGISANVDVLEARAGSAKQFERPIALIRTEVNRLSALMRDLLDYGRAGRQAQAPESIERIVSDAVALARELAEASGVRLVNCVASSVPAVFVDRGRVVQIVHNLLQNAIQHSPASGVVRIEASSEVDGERPWVVLTICDSGPGFSPSDLPRVFEPFFSRRRGGTGLGLAIVQRIVEEQGGTIVAGNRPDGGALMTLRLPCLPQSGTLA